MGGAHLAVNRHETLVILVSIDGQTGVSDDGKLDGVAGAEDAELLEFFQLLQRVRREFGQAEEEGPAVGVDAEVLEEASRAAGEVGSGIADKGDRAAAEIEGTAVAVADDFDAVGIV